MVPAFQSNDVKVAQPVNFDRQHHSSYDKLLQWKEQRHTEQLSKCLLLKGARQVGKSFIVQAFGKKEYASFLTIDFFRQPEMKGIFDGELTADEILKRITAYVRNFELIPGDTLIFLDEIQCCGNARTAIKYLAMDFRFDVISSGSLLGLTYGEDDDAAVEIPSSVPVGYETQMTMHSLDFEEFLWADGYDAAAIEALKSYYQSGTTIPRMIHDKYESLFREFIVVGGMPEVVNDYVQHHDFNRVDRIQRDILTEYRDDISKHAKGREKILVRMCYDAIPVQLTKEQKKFQYSTVERGQTRKKYGGSVQWLKDSAMVQVCYNLREPHLPLMANANEDQFKIYWNDTGLLCCAYGPETKLAVLNDTISGNARGGIYENVISECLIKNGHTLYYYKPDSIHEIEFFIESCGTVIPIEVKAGNRATPSLNQFISNYHPPFAYKLTNTQNGRVEEKITLPHYMAMFI